MNWDKIKDNWDSYRPLALGEWPGLTEMDLARIAGNRTRLIELLRDDYDMTLEEATQAADSWAEGVTGN